MTQKTHSVSLTAEELLPTMRNWRSKREDYRGAFKNLLIARTRGDILSSLNVGNRFAAGHGVRKDLTTARWHKRAYRNEVSDRSP